MKSPGMMLREAREERGLTLTDVAAMTRIPKTMLGHLENDRFEEYVAEVFVRGHLRNYAREVRLDSEAVLQSYERFTGRRRQDPMMEAKKKGVVASPRSMSKSLTPAGASAGRGGAMSVDSIDEPKSMGRSSYRDNIRPSHLVAVALILFGIFVMFSFLSSNRATAQDPTTFPVVDESSWELEQDVEQTRWLLEQSERSE